MINFLHHHLIKHLKYGLGGDSIPAVARERASIAPPFCTPPGSPFRALSPNGYPLMEPTCHRGEKNEILIQPQNPKSPKPNINFKFNECI